MFGRAYGAFVSTQDVGPTGRRCKPERPSRPRKSDRADRDWRLAVIEFRLAVTRDEELGARYHTIGARSLELKSEVAEQMVANGAIVGSHDFRTMATAAFIFESGLALEDLAADEPHRRRTDLTADDDQDRPCHRDRQCALRRRCSTRPSDDPGRPALRRGDLAPGSTAPGGHRGIRIHARAARGGRGGGGGDQWA